MNRDLILKGIADNEPLFNAVKELLLERLAINDSTLSADMSDELIGQITRARLGGRQLVEAAFNEIARLRAPKEVHEGVNPAR